MSHANNTAVVNVDVVSDIMCPWCFVGFKHLQRAIASVGPDMTVVVRWLPFQLDATLPKEGKGRAQYLSEKFGGEDRAKEIYGRIKQAGRASDIDFNFDAIAVSPNTFDAHRLIALAGQAGPAMQNRVVELLFEAFFLDGRNIGLNTELALLAAKAGMDESLVADFLASDELSQEVQAMLASVHGAGISGVPFFIFNRKAGVPGAQPVELLAEKLRKAADK